MMKFAALEPQQHGLDIQYVSILTWEACPTAGEGVADEAQQEPLFSLASMKVTRLQMDCISSRAANSLGFRV